MEGCDPLRFPCILAVVLQPNPLEGEEHLKIWDQERSEVGENPACSLASRSRQSRAVQNSHLTLEPCLGVSTRIFHFEAGTILLP